MTEYAKIGKDGRVETVIVIEPEMLATGRWGDPSEWVENDPVKRKHAAGKGYTYDRVKDEFVPPKVEPTVERLTITGNATRG